MPIGDGATALAIAVPGGPCLNPQDVPWLATDPGRGVTAANGFAPVDVTLDGSSLPNGVYKTKICIESDTPFKHVVAVPVTFTVGTPDTIFAGGFEAN